MFALAWLLVVSLLTLTLLLVWVSITGGRGISQGAFRTGLLAGGMSMLVIATLLAWETLGGGGAPTAAAAGSIAADPFGGVGPPLAAQGRQVYLRSGCHACHTIGAGPLVGPDLIDAGAKYDEAFLVRWISDPEGVCGDLGLESINPEYPRMPEASEVSEEEALMIARYLRSFSRRG